LAGANIIQLGYLLSNFCLRFFLGFANFVCEALSEWRWTKDGIFGYKQEINTMAML